MNMRMRNNVGGPRAQSRGGALRAKLPATWGAL